MTSCMLRYDVTHQLIIDFIFCPFLTNRLSNAVKILDSLQSSLEAQPTMRLCNLSMGTPQLICLSAISLE